MSNTLFDKKPEVPSYIKEVGAKLMQKETELINAKNVKPDNDWFNEKNFKETILLYGHPKGGKTWAYCSIIKAEIDAGNNVYVLSTDGGLLKTLKLFIGDNWIDYAKKINYYDIDSINAGVSALKKIQETIQPNDWLIIDLISDFWQMSQDKFVENSSMGRPEDYVMIAQKDVKKFGLLDSSKWIYCKKLDNMITQSIFYKLKCNILGVASAKDIDVGEKIGGGQKDVANDMFREVGFRPAGQKEIAYRFSTVIFIGGINKKFFKIVGDRGYKINSEPQYYGVNFWDKMKELRGQK